MIPIMVWDVRNRGIGRPLAALAAWFSVAAPVPALAATAPVACLSSGDGYFRAHIAGAIDADIDWPNSGTTCEGESRSAPVGIRMSFSRVGGSRPDLLFVFGLTGVQEGQALRAGGVNLTVIEQGTSRIFGTLGDRRCSVDSLTQRRLDDAHTYRLEVRGFCTQPARAVRGSGELLISRFDFAGRVTYFPGENPR